MKKTFNKFESKLSQGIAKDLKSAQFGSKKKGEDEDKQNKFLNLLFNLLRLFLFPFVAIWTLFGINKVGRWMRKMEKRKDPELYPLRKRLDLINSYNKRLLWILGIKLKVEGIDNVPNGSCFILPNHQSNYDGFLIQKAIFEKNEPLYIAKHEVLKSKFKNIAEGMEWYLIKRKSLKQTVAVINMAIKRAKEDQRPLVIFPEGTRSEDPNKYGEWSAMTFKLAQNHYQTIIPTTINFSRKAEKNKFSLLRRNIVYITFSPPIKATTFTNKNPDRIAKEAKATSFKNLKKNQ